MLKILIVDDEPDLVLMLKSRLESQDYAVETANDGVAALEAVNEFDPDLIVLDIHMPKMDGYRFLEELRSRSENKTRPAVIVLTARKKMREAFDPTKISAFLEKPFNSQDLISKVNEVCKTIRDKETVPKILLIGSNWDSVRPIKKLLESQDLQVVVSFDGPGAIELSVVHKPKVIFCPSLVNGMDILVLFGTLKSMPATRGIPLVIYETQLVIDPLTLDKLRADRVLTYETQDELLKKTQTCLQDLLRKKS